MSPVGGRSSGPVKTCNWSIYKAQLFNRHFGSVT